MFLSSTVFVGSLNSSFLGKRLKMSLLFYRSCTCLSSVHYSSKNWIIAVVIVRLAKVFVIEISGIFLSSLLLLFAMRFLRNLDDCKFVILI